MSDPIRSKDTHATFTDFEKKFPMNPGAISSIKKTKDIYNQLAPSPTPSKSLPLSSWEKIKSTFSFTSSSVSAKDNSYQNMTATEFDDLVDSSSTFSLFWNNISKKIDAKIQQLQNIVEKLDLTELHEAPPMKGKEENKSASLFSSLVSSLSFTSSKKQLHEKIATLRFLEGEIQKNPEAQKFFRELSDAEVEENFPKQDNLDVSHQTEEFSGNEKSPLFSPRSTSGSFSTDSLSSMSRDTQEELLLFPIGDSTKDLLTELASSPNNQEFSDGSTTPPATSSVGNTSASVDSIMELFSISSKSLSTYSRPSLIDTSFPLENMQEDSLKEPMYVDYFAQFTKDNIQTFISAPYTPTNKKSPPSSIESQTTAEVSSIQSENKSSVPRDLTLQQIKPSATPSKQFSPIKKSSVEEQLRKNATFNSKDSPNGKKQESSPPSSFSQASTLARFRPSDSTEMFWLHNESDSDTDFDFRAYASSLSERWDDTDNSSIASDDSDHSIENSSPMSEEDEQNFIEVYAKPTSPKSSALANLSSPLAQDTLNQTKEFMGAFGLICCSLKKKIDLDKDLLVNGVLQFQARPLEDQKLIVDRLLRSPEEKQAAFLNQFAPSPLSSNIIDSHTLSEQLEEANNLIQNHKAQEIFSEAMIPITSQVAMHPQEFSKEERSSLKGLSSRLFALGSYFTNMGVDLTKAFRMSSNMALLLNTEKSNLSSNIRSINNKIQNIQEQTVKEDLKVLANPNTIVDTNKIADLSPEMSQNKATINTKLANSVSCALELSSLFTSALPGKEVDGNKFVKVLSRFFKQSPSDQKKYLTGLRAISPNDKKKVAQELASSPDTIHRIKGETLTKALKDAISTTPIEKEAEAFSTQLLVAHKKTEEPITPQMVLSSFVMRLLPISVNKEKTPVATTLTAAAASEIASSKSLSKPNQSFRSLLDQPTTQSLTKLQSSLDKNKAKISNALMGNRKSNESSHNEFQLNPLAPNSTYTSPSTAELQSSISHNKARLAKTLALGEALKANSPKGRNTAKKSSAAADDDQIDQPIQNTVSSLKTKISGLEREKAKLETNIQSLHSKIQTAEQTKQSHITHGTGKSVDKKDIDNMRQNLDGLERKLAALESNIAEQLATPQFFTSTSTRTSHAEVRGSSEQMLVRDLPEMRIEEANEGLPHPEPIITQTTGVSENSQHTQVGLGRNPITPTSRHQSLARTDASAQVSSVTPFEIEQKDKKTYGNDLTGWINWGLDSAAALFKGEPGAKTYPFRKKY